MKLLVFAAAIAAAQPIVLNTSTILDGKGGTLRNQQIVIDGSKITAVKSGKAKVDYDLRGLTVMPGWIDTHVHLEWHMDSNNKSVATGKPEDRALYDARDAWMELQDGFTTVQSVGSAPDAPVRDRINQGVLLGPRVLTSL